MNNTEKRPGPYRSAADGAVVAFLFSVIAAKDGHDPVMAALFMAGLPVTTLSYIGSGHATACHSWDGKPHTFATISALRRYKFFGGGDIGARARYAAVMADLKQHDFNPSCDVSFASPI